MTPRGRGCHGARPGEKNLAPRAGRLPRNVFASFTLRSLAANRVRSAVTVAGIALATGLLMAVLVSVTSLQSGLANQSRETDGVWQAAFPNTDDAELQRLREAAGDRLDRLATQRDLGSAVFSREDAERNGTFLTVVALPEEQGGTTRAMGDDAYDVINEPEVVEGRLPEAPGEIAVTTSLLGEEPTPGATDLPGVEAGVASDGPIQVGSSLTLTLGRRYTPSLDGTSPAATGSSETYESVVTGTYPDGTPRVEPGDIAETLEAVGDPRAYTVVGIVSPDWSVPGFLAYVSPDETGGSTEPLVNARFSTTCTSRADLDALVESVRPGGGESGYYVNEGLLTYEGLGRDRFALDTVGMFAATLAATIVVAAVSLISNSFAISVSERTRQFGLLSSLGASKRQLRRTVLLEAAVLGVAGVPLGMLLGVAGAAVAFAVTGDGWASMVGTETAVTLVVRPWCVLLTAALACATLLVSAAVPAVRAGRVPAVDAIRQAQDVRPNRRLRRVFSRRRCAMDDLTADGRRPRGLAALVGGVPAFLARRTLAVSASKSRVAVLSLAVSVTLLVTAGVVGDLLSAGLNVTTDSMGPYDLRVVTSDATAGTDTTGASDGSDAAAAAVGSSALDAADDLLARISGIDGVGAATYVGEGTATVRLSEGLLDRDALAEAGDSAGAPVDGAGYAIANVVCVDDDTWCSLADSGVIDLADADPFELQAVLVGTLDANDGQRYGVRRVSPEGATGVAELLVLSSREGYGDPATSYDSTGSVDGYAAYYTPTNATDTDSQLVVPVQDAVSKSTSVPVVAVADDLGTNFPLSAASLRAGFPTLVMPASAVRETPGALQALLDSYRNLWVEYDVRLAEGAVDARVLGAMEGAVGDTEGVSLLRSDNIAALARDARARSFTAQVFLYCFAAIMTAISVANVFNTIASGMMLRTREFAALRSVGMDGRSFRLMILVECADYAVRGLLIGAVLSLLVELFLHRAMILSVSGLAFEVPWGHIALAFVVVVAVLAASVAYALRKTHAMNLVEALRADAL